MSIIEAAARRLEELRRSGIALPPPDARSVGKLHGDHPDAPAPAAAHATERASAQGSRLVEVDRSRLVAQGLLFPDAPRSRLADEFRAIKRPLVANVRGESAAPVQRANCIMITSAVPGEGKTFTAINLAMSMAMEVDSRVLLIDADVIRPSILGRLGLPPAKGLLDKLITPALPLSDLILRTNIDKFSLLPAGEASTHATELLGSDAMRRVVDELAMRYSDRIIIFDAPPLLVAPETRVLASLVGQIVVVVEAQKTPRRAVHDALALIEGCPVVMTMLNKVRDSGAAPYGYGYGYGYGQRNNENA